MSNRRKTPEGQRFTADSAKRAQPLAVASRRATDEKLRRRLALRLPAMSLRLRRMIADRVPIRMVVDLLWTKS